MLITFHWYHWAISTGLPVLGVASWLGNKLVVSPLKAGWQSAVDKLTVIETTTKTQAENHLATIQSEAKRHTEILQSMAAGQEAIRIAMAESNGYLKGILEKK
jgi:hypothetical protein